MDVANQDQDLELERCILHGALDDALVAHNANGINTQDSLASNRGESASIGVELASLEPVKSTPPMRNPARERRKRELGFLREYVTELESELMVLRAQQQFRRIENSAEWKMLADSERLKRLESEDQNERLRLSLETHLRIADELSRFYLHDYPAALDASPSIVASFESMLQEIDQAYPMTDSVFDGLHWTALPDERVFTTTIKTRSLNATIDQLYIDLFDTAHRSFAYDRVCAAAWEATRVVYANEARVLDVGPSNDDVLAVKYRTTGQTRRGVQKDLIVTFVAKKFEGRDRTVVVWRTINSPAAFDTDMPMSAVSDETGWMVLTRVGGNEATATRPADTAFFQACNRLVPMWLDGDGADASVRTQLAIGEFTNVVLSATEADVTGFETAFQRLVLDDATIDDAGGMAKPEGLVAYV